MAKAAEIIDIVSDKAIFGDTCGINEMFTMTTVPDQKRAIAFALSEAVADMITHREGPATELPSHQLQLAHRLFIGCDRHPVLRDALVSGFCVGAVQVLQREASPAATFQRLVDYAVGETSPHVLAGALRDAVRPAIRIHSALSENPQDNPFVTNFNRLNLVAG